MIGAKRILAAFAIVAAAMLGGGAAAQAQPTFSASFSPSTVAVGSESTLIFTITNGSGSAVSDMTFSNVLPAGVTVAPSPQTSTTCTDGTVNITAADAFTFEGLESATNGARLGANASCTVSLNVATSSGGSFMNTSGDLTSSAGNSGTASATLTVDAARLQFDMAFSPSTIGTGGASTITYTITNPAATVRTSVTFTNTLPSGLVVASPNGVATTCTGGTASGASGGSTIQLAGGFFTAAGSCTVVADVTSSSAGTYVNSATLSSSGGTSGAASDTLTVTAPTGALTLVKQFDRTSVAPGGTIDMTFTLGNTNGSSSATAISFTDDLDAALSGLQATSLPASGFCGPGSSISGSSSLTISNASLDPRSNCTFTVTLSVPSGIGDQTVTNTTSSVSGQVDGSPVSGDPASASFNVVELTPVMTKSFTNDPTTAGGTVTLEYTITNPSSTTALGSIAFSDSLVAMANASIVSGTGSDLCGSGSFVLFQEISGTPSVVLTGGNLAAGGSCTFPLTLSIPANAPSGDYVSTSSDVTSDGGTGAPATDTLTISPPDLNVSLIKTFTDDPVLPGGTTTLEFTLSNDGEAAAITDLSFTDDLDGMLSGAVAVGLPANDVCGTGSQVSGTSLMTLTGGNLAAGDSCTFQISVQVPGGAANGTYPNTTSDVSGDAGSGVTTATGTAASDTLSVSDVIAVTGTKSFTDDPVVAGADVTLQFTLTNPNAGDDATNIAFTDNLNGMGLPTPGLTLSGALPTDPCGTGSALSLSSGGGTTGTLSLSGGNILAGQSCTFSATFTVPSNAAANNYGNTTSTISSTVNATSLSASAMMDTLTVSSPFENVFLTKTFTDDPVEAGGTVTLQFALDNSVNSVAIDSATFTDDLTQMGFAASATGDAGSCTGGGTWSVTGGTNPSATVSNLPGGAICTFSIDVAIPSGASAGIHSNTTSTVSVDIGGSIQTIAAATDELTVSPTMVTFQKSITGTPVTPGGDLTYTYTILTPGTGSALSDIRFAEDLDAVLTGLAATDLPKSDVCGGGSSLTVGASGIELTGGNLTPPETCQFTVTVSVPSNAAPGTYTSTSSQLFETTTPIASASSDTFEIENPADNLTFSLAYSNDPVFAGEGASATYSISNPDAASTITDIGFTHDLAGTITGATFTAGTNTCGGSVTGTGMLTLSGASLAPGASCTITVTVNVPSGTTANDYTMTTGAISGSVNGSVGTAGTASDVLSVEDPADVTFTKSFTNDPVAPGASVTVQYTIDNTASTAALSNLNFSEDLDSVISGMTATANSNVCGSGSAVTPTGTGFDMTGGTIAAGGQCTFSVTLQVPTTAAPGNHSSTSGALLAGSAQINAGASDTLVISNPADNLTFSLEFTDDPVFAGAAASATYTITNPSSTSAITAVGFAHDLATDIGAGTTFSTTSNSCGGSATGTGTLTYSGGSLAANGSCTIVVDVTVPVGTSAGDYPTTTGQLSGSVNGVASTAGPTANDTLAVVSTSGITFTKTFTDDPVAPGGTVTVQYEITNPNPTAPLSDLNFTDDLDAALSGLAVDTLPSGASCGGSVTGTTSVNLTGGSLAADGTCSFTVTLSVPANAPPGGHVSTSGALFDGSLQVASGPSDTLTVSNPADNLTFSLEFTDDPIAPGTAATAQFTITNPDTVVTATGLGFTMAVDGVISGATVSGSTPASPCGGATVSGGSSLTVSGGSLAPGANCTFTVDVTVPLATTAGSYPFTTSDLDASVNGTATTVAAASDTLQVGAAPEFTITTGDFTSSGPEGGPFAPASMNYVVENTSTFPLTFSVAANQPYISLEDTGGAPTTGGTIPGGGTQTVVVVIDQAVAGNAGTYMSGNTYDGLVTFTNLSAPAPGNEETREADLMVEQTGQVTIVQTTVAGDATFGYSSTPSSALGTSITTTDGYGENEVMDLLAGQYVVTQVPPDGYGLVSLTCTETGGTSNSMTNVDSLTATITLEPGESIVCTFESANSRERTTEVINRFLQRRVDMILSNEPGQNRRVDRLKNRFGGGASGTGTPFDVTASEAGTGGVAMAFETSVSQIRSAYAAQDQAKEALLATSGVFANNPSGLPAQETLWDVWFRGSVTWFDDNTGGTDSDGFFAIFHAGADYLLTDRILVGALVQLDYLDQDFSTLNASANGVGWMAGPYATVRLTDNLYFDTRAAWGTSENEVSPFNTYTDDFSTTRWLVRAGLIGDWDYGAWNFRPSANLAYMEETQEAYTDSLNVAIPEQTVGIGQLDFGPEISYTYQDPKGWLISPSAKVTGIWNFHRDTSGVTTTTQSAAVEMRAKAELGVNVRMPNGVRVEANGSYDGIGSQDYSAVSGKMKLSVPLN